MPDAPHTSETRFRVRYAETDKMGVVYYANYFVWMEIGRTDYCRTVGFTYRDMEAEEANLAVAEAACRYLAPALYDDEIVVRTTIARLSRRVIAFEYSIVKADSGQALAEGRTVHIAVGRDGKTRSIPERYLRLLAQAASHH
jgi:acyl-CoA thioester hydrolase